MLERVEGEWAAIITEKDENNKSLQERVNELEAEVNKERDLVRETRAHSEINYEQQLCKLEREKR